MKFKISISTPSNLPINNLTFIVAPSVSNLDNLLLNEFLDNPNIQNEENVILLGNYGSDSPNSSIDFEFTWKSFPPLQNPLFHTDEKGTKLICCFAEYDKRDHSLKQLARFAIWIDSDKCLNPLHSKKSEFAQENVSQPKPQLHSQSPLSIANNNNNNNQLSKTLSNNLDTLPEHAEIDRLNYPLPELPTKSHSPLAQIKTTSYPGSPDSIDRQAYFSHSESLPKPLRRRSSQDVSSLDSVTMGGNSNTSNNNAEQPQPEKPHHTVSSLILPDPKLPPPHVPNKTPTTEASFLESPNLNKDRPKLNISRPKEGTIPQPEDGPIFRSQIAEYEKRTGILKAKAKKFLKRAMAVRDCQAAMIKAHSEFIASIRDIGDSEISSFKTLIQYYFDQGNYAYFYLELLRKSQDNITRHVIEPVRHLYDQEIKAFDQRKKEFDDESREYYAWLSRYLSVKQEAKGKKKSDSDTKYGEKRKAFELCRFDYYSFLQDLHGGRKQQTVTYHLAIFAQEEINHIIQLGERINNNSKKTIDMIANETKVVSKEWSRHRAEREEHRRAIERSSNITKDSISNQNAPLPLPSTSNSAVNTEMASPLLESFPHTGFNPETTAYISSASSNYASNKSQNPAASNTNSNATTSVPVESSTTTTVGASHANHSGPLSSELDSSSAPASSNISSSTAKITSATSSTSLNSSSFPKSQGYSANSGNNATSGIGLGLAATGNNTTQANTSSRPNTTPPPTSSHIYQNHASPMSLGSPDKNIISPTIGEVYDSANAANRTSNNASNASNQINTNSNSNNANVSAAAVNTSMATNKSNNNLTTSTSNSSANSNDKEGLLWAMSRPGGLNDQINLNKPGWHKFWVVLGGGRLCEYTNWKQGVDLHNEPINLKMALVREARNSERRFCFEVVTPNYKRVYQATSEEDMQSWIRSINNAISSSLEDSSQTSLRDYGSSNIPNPSSSSAENNAGNSASNTSNSALPRNENQSSSLSHHGSFHHHHLHSKSTNISSKGPQSYDDASNQSTSVGSSSTTANLKKDMNDLKGEFAKLNVRKVSLRRSNLQKSSSSSEKSHGLRSSANALSRNATTSNSSLSYQNRPSDSNRRSSLTGSGKIPPITGSSNNAPSNTTSNSSSGSRIADIVRSLDQSNCYCADCGQSNKVEWISINLLVIVCIECSGVHRSLGSHISKVRSLTLDTVSFTPDLVELIKSVNNSIVNSIWEQNYPQPKNTNYIAEHRVEFIRAKYIEKKYVNILDRPNTVLRNAVKNRNVKEVLQALASRANPSTQMIHQTIPSDDAATQSGAVSQPEDEHGSLDESLVMYSLRTSPRDAVTFPITELLILNSADLPSVPISQQALNKLSPNAYKYLMTKVGNREGAKSPVGISAGMKQPQSMPIKNISNTYITDDKTQSGGYNNSQTGNVNNSNNNNYTSKTLPSSSPSPSSASSSSTSSPAMIKSSINIVTQSNDTNSNNSNSNYSYPRQHKYSASTSNSRITSPTSGGGYPSSSDDKRSSTRKRLSFGP